MPHATNTTNTIPNFCSVKSLRDALYVSRGSDDLRCIQYGAPFSVNGRVFRLKHEHAGPALYGHSQRVDEFTGQLAIELKTLCARSRDLKLPWHEAPGDAFIEVVSRHLKKGSPLTVRMPHCTKEYRAVSPENGRYVLAEACRGQDSLPHRVLAALSAWFHALRALFSPAIRIARDQQVRLESAIRKELARQETPEPCGGDQPRFYRIGSLNFLAQRMADRQARDGRERVKDQPADSPQRLQHDPTPPALHQELHQSLPQEESIEVAQKQEDAELPAVQAMLDVQASESDSPGIAGTDATLETASPPSPQEAGPTAQPAETPGQQEERQLFEHAASAMA